ncbi:hypothetical protein BT67DRAFT_479193 [Trichocladium antarcticum]|uniref:Uncharacterized protein n=1 Tax=Trichocladium antarcticum TaxID=1450529 RepID=A0AAN6ZCD4_9PEZI|nr:hypothetical protein BT67DRAFT_479193 [Trichocladium antarcticum]
MPRRSRKATIYIEATGLLLFKRLVSIFTKGNNTLPASPATAPAAAAATTTAAAAATAATALATLPDLEPDPIYNINKIYEAKDSICSICKETAAMPAANPFFASPYAAATPSTSLELRAEPTRAEPARAELERAEPELTKG